MLAICVSQQQPWLVFWTGFWGHGWHCGGCCEWDGGGRKKADQRGDKQTACVFSMWKVPSAVAI